MLNLALGNHGSLAVIIQVWLQAKTLPKELESNLSCPSWYSAKW